MHAVVLADFRKRILTLVCKGVCDATGGERNNLGRSWASDVRNTWVSDVENL